MTGGAAAGMLLVALAAAPALSAGSPPGVVARCPGGEVTAAEVEACVAKLRAGGFTGTDAAVAEHCTDSLLVRKILLAGARAAKLQEDEVYLAQRQNAVERSMSQRLLQELRAAAAPGEEEIAAALNRDFTYDFLWARWEARERAERGDADWQELAPAEDRGHAEGKGGSLPLTEGLLREVRKVGRGQVSPVIAHDGRHWVVKVLSYKLPSGHAPDREAALKSLETSRLEAAKKQLLADLRKSAPVELEGETIRKLVHGERIAQLEETGFVRAGKVGGKPFYLDKFDSVTPIHGGLSAEQDREYQAETVKRRLQALADRALLATEAVRRGYLEDERERAALQDFSERLLATIYLERQLGARFSVTEDDVRARYERDRERYAVGERVRYEGLVFATEAQARLFLGAAGTGEALRAAVKQQLAARERLQALPPAQRRAAEDGTALSQLSPGWMAVDQVPEGLRETVRRLQPGVAELAAGMEGGRAVVLWLEGREAPKVLPLEEVREAIGKQLREENRARLLKPFLEQLLADPSVERFPEASPGR